jgi:hypothetical protein
MLTSEVKAMLNYLTVLAVAPLTLVSTSSNVLPLESAGLRGSIDVTSYGVAELSADGDVPIQTLHVRLTYSNRGDPRPWTIDVTAMRVEVGSTVAAPLFVNSDAITLPFVRVGKNEHRVVDAYFELPIGELDTLAVMHRLNTPDQRYEGRVVLRRAASVDDAQASPRIGWGSRWWATNDHSWPAFYHRDGRLVPRPPLTVVITRAPQATYELAPVDDETWLGTECDQW